MNKKILALAIFASALMSVQASATGVLVQRDAWGNAVGHTHLAPCYGYPTHLGSSANDYMYAAPAYYWGWGY